jgi:TRAP-type mannitol/chloroaromatic compound transport system permease large subunit
MSDQLGRSVGDMYVGAFLPAMMIIGMYCAYIFFVTLIRRNGRAGPAAEFRTLGGGVTLALSS